jgi:centromere/kinetochore protein ZW10
MYMSHHCLTISNQYKTLFNEIKREENSELIDFKQLILKLRKLAQNFLNEQIHAQCQLLKEYLKNDNMGLNQISEGNNSDLYEKSLQKCFIQIRNLSNLWYSILSEPLYMQIFGRFYELINEHTCESIICLEDMSTDDAVYLNKLLYSIQKNAIDLFSRNSSVELNLVDLKLTRFINNWMKFKYLIRILNANLQEIVDLWSQSMGPLALYFNVDEVRHLIRALFMNNDRRAIALSKIN